MAGNELPECVHRFLSAYDALDDLMRAQLGRHSGDSHTAMLTAFADSNSAVRAHLGTLKRFAELRNLLQHDADRRRWPAMAVPDIRAVELYEQIVHGVKYEPTALERCVPRSKLFVADMPDRVVDVMKTMAKHGYSQAPVLESGVVIGVFSESTPFSMVASESEVLIDRGMAIRDCRQFLDLDRQVNEAFLFISRAATWAAVGDLFVSNRENARRVGAVFVTENGKRTEKLLGMITAWDLA